MLDSASGERTRSHIKGFRGALDAIGAIKVSDPGQSPGTAASDFYLFGNLKEKLQSVVVKDRDSLISATTEISSEPLQNELIAIYWNWMK
jgi:hypothetical protein